MYVFVLVKIIIKLDSLRTIGETIWEYFKLAIGFWICVFLMMYTKYLY
jgi:hypothetical protein